MNTTLVIALLIPWVFWGIVMGLMKIAGRSWINLVLIPAGITVVLLIVAGVTSGNEVFRLSVILHVLLLLVFVVSLLRFLHAEHKNNNPH